MKDTLLLRFLYKTIPGRFILNILVNPVISQMGGYFLSLKISRIFIPGFIRKNKIDMTGIDIPAGGFLSFNDFFKRSKKDFRIEAGDNEIISPCDGLLSIVNIDEETVFEVKNTCYKVDRLLRSKNALARYKGGVAFIYRLTPTHYHRYSYCGRGTVAKSRKITGILHCVRPVALSERPVFIENAREYQEVILGNKTRYVQMEVGALMVGKISNHPDFTVGSIVSIGQEKGCFEFGGSTIICIYQKDAIEFEGVFAKESNEEIPVKIGQKVGTIK